MEQNEQEIPELEITAPQRQNIVIPEGIYEAKLSGYKVIDTTTKWGPKKTVLFTFEMTNNKFEGEKVFARFHYSTGTNGEYFISKKSKLAEAINAINRNGKISKNDIGKLVMIKIKNNVGKDGNTYNNVDMVIPMPTSKTTTSVKQTQQPAQQQVKQQAVKSEASIDLDDLTEI